MSNGNLSVSAFSPDQLEFDSWFRQTRDLSFLCLAAWMILVYDTLLTFDDEVTHIWRRKFKIGSLLYILARYGTILALTDEVAQELMQLTDVGSQSTGMVLNTFLSAFQIIGSIAVHGLVLGRALVVCHKKRLLKALLIILFLLIQINSLLLIWLSARTYSEQLEYLMTVMNNSFLVAFELAVLWVTIRYTYQLYLQEGRQTSLFGLMLAQGILRWLLISTWTLLSFISNSANGPGAEVTDGWQENAISVILVCRFFLLLREYGQKAAQLPAPSGQISRSRSLIYSIFHGADQILEDFRQEGDEERTPLTKFDMLA